MIKIAGDTHTHTVACDHAYSTVMENIAQAKEMGHSFLCMTEHAPAMPGGPSQIYFATLEYLPRVIDGVTIIKGAELNILDFEGNVDLPVGILERLEWVIASYHPPCLARTTPAEHTGGWIKIAENPLIHVIGHCDRDWFEFEHLPALRAFKEFGKVVEINSHSLRSPRAATNCRKIATLCAEMAIPVVVSSDSHVSCAVGAVGPAVAILEEIGFPQELILNADHDRFFDALNRFGTTLD